MRECIIQEEDLRAWSRSNLWPPCVSNCISIVCERTLDVSCAVSTVFESTGLSTVDVDRVVVNAVVENCNLHGHGMMSKKTHIKQHLAHVMLLPLKNAIKSQATKTTPTNEAS